MDDKELCAALLTIDSDAIGAGLSNNWHRNPDGPEAAARIEALSAERRTFTPADVEAAARAMLKALPWGQVIHEPQYLVRAALSAIGTVEE